MKKLITMVFAGVMALCVGAGDVTATAVTAQQRYPWDGKVDITVTFSGVSNDVAQAVCRFVATNNATHAALNISHVTGDSEVSGSGSTWMRRFVWDATADNGEVKIAEVALTVVSTVPLDGVQLWENGPYWAECNVGAAKPEECGYYFWWGDTVGYERNANNNGWIFAKGSFSFWFDSGKCPTYNKTTSQLQSAGYIDSTGNLVTAHDAATAHLGSPWRMPTNKEFSALINNCTMTWMTTNGVYGQLVYGRLVTGKGAYSTKSIFLPAAGYGYGDELRDHGSSGNYWSSTPDSGNSNCYACDLTFSSGGFNNSKSRHNGQSVRPVRGFAYAVSVIGEVSTHFSLGFAVSVTSVTAQQRYPWSGMVDVVVTLTGASNDAANAVCTFVATNSATHAALSVSHVTGDSMVSGSGSTWTRRFVWDATADVGEVKIADAALSVTANAPLGGVQLWENGPYWAECNVGASKPEEYGCYFWWGDTVGYRANTDNATFASGYYWNGVRWVSSVGAQMSSSPFSSSVCPTYGKSDSQLMSAYYGYIDSNGNLVAAHDAATARLDAPWRMPSAQDLDDLMSKCMWRWTTRNGVNGYQVTGEGLYATKNIFLPAGGYGDGSYLFFYGACGCYLSSTTYSDDSDKAWILSFGSSGFGRYSDYYRFYGQSVRPLRDSNRSLQGFKVSSTATTHLTLDTRTGTRYARAEEQITFSTSWNEGVTRLVLSVDGVNVLTSDTATNGVYVWKPDLSTTRTVTLKHTTRGTVNEALTATFITAAYDVTFAAGAHGTLAAGVPTTQRVPHGEAAVVPEVVPVAGYRFAGWSADTSSVTENVTATALYEAIPYAITYEDLHGATHANPSTYTIEDGVTFSAPSAIPRRQFVRWEPASIAVGSMGAVTIRAVWEMTPYVYVDAAKGNDAWDGSSVEQAVKTLARAYALAEAGDVIVVAAGAYAPVTAKGKVVTFRGADGVTIDGGDANRCVTADNEVVFENFILQNGYDAEAGGGAYGGTFERCTISDCHSDWDGGGAYEAILRNCVIAGNTAENGWGGGACGGTLVGCVVKDNVAGDMGGGVYAPEILLDTTFSGNSPDDLAGDEGKVAAGSSFVYAPPGSTTAYAVSYDWLLATGLAKVGDSTAGLGTKLADVYANGYTGWESYVAGLSPNDATIQFRAAITITNEKVCVSWTPELKPSQADLRTYTIYGKVNLQDDTWLVVDEDAENYNFFKVTVEMK